MVTWSCVFRTIVKSQAVSPIQRLAQSQTMCTVKGCSHLAIVANVSNQHHWRRSEATKCKQIMSKSSSGFKTSTASADLDWNQWINNNFITTTKNMNKTTLKGSGKVQCTIRTCHFTCARHFIIVHRSPGDKCTWPATSSHHDGYIHKHQSCNSDVSITMVSSKRKGQE